MSNKIEIQNVNTPGKTSRVDEEKYLEIKRVLLAILPSDAPGLSHKRIIEAAKDEASDALFPGGEKLGWWTKTVQLDLEAKGILIRHAGKPLSWFKTSFDATA